MNTLTVNQVNDITKKTWNYLKINDATIKVEDLPKSGLCTPNKAHQAIKMGCGANLTHYLDSVCAVRKLVEIEASKDTHTLTLDITPDVRLQSTDIVVKEGAKAHIALSASGVFEENRTLAQTLRIIVEKNAHVTLDSVVHAPNATYIENIGVELHENAQIDFTNYLLSAHTIVVGHTVTSAGDQSRFSEKARYLVQNSENTDIHLCGDLYHKSCRGDMDVSGVLKDRAKKRLAMTIDLKKGCKGSSGSENETSLIFGDSTINKTIPLILCHEDEVSANHGATIGSISDEQLCYLKSRGLSSDEIVEIFVRSVAEDALLHLAPESTGYALAQEFLSTL